MSKDVSEGLRLAAVDIGTNSVRLLIIQFKQGKPKILSRKIKITRLGEEVNQNKALADKAVSRTIVVLKEYQREIEAKKVQRVRVATTSAAREAENADHFLAQVKEKLGFDVEILSGRQEAELTFRGVTAYSRLPCLPSLPVRHRARQGLRPRRWQAGWLSLQAMTGRRSGVGRRATPDSRLLLVIDIGGGSTELILGRGENLEKLYSLDVGCVRLTEMFLKTDPPTKTEIDTARKYIDEVIHPPIDNISQLATRNSQLVCIGVAGTITTLVAVKKKMKVYDSSKVHGSKLTKSDINEMLKLVLDKPLDERKKVIGLEPARADVIIAGILILQEILSYLGVKEIVVSENDILDGLILSQIPDCIS